MRQTQKVEAEVLLVEDNPGDVRLIREAFRETLRGITIHTVESGTEALSFLQKEGPFAGVPRPDLILLDLNLPQKDGREVLRVVKSDPSLKVIPVIALTSSEAEQDIVRTYNLHVNCYVVKPMELDHFLSAIRSIVQFWFGTVRLPRGNG